MSYQAINNKMHTTCIHFKLYLFIARCKRCYKQVQCTWVSLKFQVIWLRETEKVLSLSSLVYTFYCEYWQKWRAMHVP